MPRAVIASPSDGASATAVDERVDAQRVVASPPAAVRERAPGADTDPRAAASAAADDAGRTRASGARAPRAALALAGAAAFDRCLKRPATVRRGAFALHVALHAADDGATPARTAADRAPNHGGDGGDERALARAATHVLEPVADDEPRGSREVRDPPVWRLGLVIPKRYEASAVARNTIKRRWRGAFRDGRGAWAGEFGGADVVVRMHGPLAPKALRAATPAQVLARAAFDPRATFGALVERLRRRPQRTEPTAAPQEQSA